MVTMADLKLVEQALANPKVPTMADLKLVEKGLSTPTTSQPKAAGGQPAPAVDPNKAAMEAAKQAYNKRVEDGVHNTAPAGGSITPQNNVIPNTQQTQPQVVYMEPDDSAIATYIKELKTAPKSEAENPDLEDDSANDNEVIG